MAMKMANPTAARTDRAECHFSASVWLVNARHLDSLLVGCKILLGCV